MANDVPDWAFILESVDFQYDPRYDITGCSSPKRDEEYELMWKQVRASRGFDIDFTKFTHKFNYKPVDFEDNDLPMEAETTRDLIDRLTQKSLEGYNEHEGTKYEFVKVIKANRHGASSGTMLYITFEGKDPCDDQPKQFQAKVWYLFFEPPMHIFCELKPDKKVHSIEETEDKEDVKKPRLTEELSTI